MNVPRQKHRPRSIRGVFSGKSRKRRRKCSTLSWKRRNFKRRNSMESNFTFWDSRPVCIPNRGEGNKKVQYRINIYKRPDTEVTRSRGLATCQRGDPDGLSTFAN
ncbi:hypothetical protein AVEN_229630-1 [Araneus ventricosus]|uniref:Uncharacterized protein n=1 Tax=Araneus ventricosus TaxID=182803 RepID=A0A4Y2HV28_ARAVE|nr:hypothetical protein AVEN_229630-1 [Araneus ventricosus]